MGQRRVGRWRHRDQRDSQRGDGLDAHIYTRTLVVHEERFRSSHADLCLNPESFPGLRIGDVIAISDAGRGLHDDPCLQTRVCELDPIKGNVQISIRKSIADLFELKNRGQVLVRILGPDEIVVLDFLQLSFSDQYISRGDMWLLKQDLTGSCVYTSKTVTVMGMTARADELLVNGKAVLCGMIGAATKLVYRSRSAMITWLIQLSKEMWDYDDDGQLYEENVVNGLFKYVFQQWQKLGVNHSLTVVLFARTFFLPIETRAPVWGPKPTLAHQAQTLLADVSNVFQTDHQQRLYQDFYKLVLEGESRRDWVSLRSLLIRDISRFSQELRWGAVDNISGIKGVPTSASDGNVLEAINLAANAFDKHFVDRDLHRTAQAVVVVTAGTGVWTVDHRLLKLTKERMVDNGIACDLISMARPPLHSVPLFVYSVQRGDQPCYCIADDWLVMKFWDEPGRHAHWVRPIHGATPEDVTTLQGGENGDGFVPIPLCRMFPASQQQNDAQTTKSWNGVVYPETPLLFNTLAVHDLDADFYDEFDRHSFCCVEGVTRQCEPGSSGGALYSPIRELGHSESFPSLGHLMSSLSPSPRLPPDIGDCHVSSLLSISTLDQAPRNEFRVPSASDNCSGSPCDLVPRRWASPPNASSLSPAVSATASAASRIRVDSLAPAPSRPGSASIGVSRHQVLFEVQHDDQCRPILVESVTAVDACESPTVPRPGTDLGLDPEQNPFRLHSPAPKLANNRRRWVHLFPKQEESLTQLNLKALCTPPILPLTTDYFPNKEQLQKEFRNTVQTLSLVPNDRRYHDRAENLLMELITQRLTNDFQLMVARARFPGSSGPTQPSIVYQLSLGGDHHQIILDRSTDNIQVHRYFRLANVAQDFQWGTSNQPAFPYRYFLWSEACAALLPIDALIRASSEVPFNWNYADQLVAGHAAALSGSNLNYRRIRFALITATSLGVGCVQDAVRLTAFLQTLFVRDVTDLNLRWISQSPEPIGTGALDAFVNIDLGFVDNADRYQSFSVHYDSIVDEVACFHLEVRWMMATGASIRRWVRDVLRPTAKDAQITLLQIPACHYQPRSPATFLSSSTSPFQAAIPISMSPLSLLNLVRSYLVLPQFGYVLDTRLTFPIQYIHTTGMSVIRIEKIGLQWIPHPKAPCAITKPQFDQVHGLCLTVLRCQGILLSLIDDILDDVQTIMW